jgi:hypothetical protein
MATLDCPHKQHLLYKTDTLIKFPIKRRERKFKNHGLLLKERYVLPSLASTAPSLLKASRSGTTVKRSPNIHKAKVVYVVKV